MGEQEEPVEMRRVQPVGSKIEEKHTIAVTMIQTDSYGATQ